VLKAAKIPVVETRLATSKKEAVEIAAKMGFPIVMKIVSPDISHKSDVGGVKLGIQNATQAGKAYSEILASVKKHDRKAKVVGVSVQKMARQGLEIIIGMTKDAQFGPVIMFGLGGILVEVLKDVSFRIVPLEKRDAAEMITEIKGFPVLKGYRGQEPANIPFLEDMIVKVSDFVEKNPDIKELDLNPVFAYKDGAMAVDARIILETA
jgi:acyl-CoA synthetase (NDP forming)